MDLIFHRYSDPYTLLNSILETESFEEFVYTIIGRDDDDKLWQLYLSKVWENISFVDFRARCKGGYTAKDEHNVQPRPKAMSRVDLEATIKDTMSIIENFEP